MSGDAVRKSSLNPEAPLGPQHYHRETSLATLISILSSADRVFSHALLTVKRIPRTGSSRPPPDARLKLYGLYKQSTEGNVSGLMPRPVGNDPIQIAEREKWDAWHANHSLTYTEAKRRYITTLIQTMHAYASTTPEARDLVAELEFVWDQIKSDPASTSSASSPDQRAQASYEGRASQRPEDGELKLLRPASEPDEAEDGEDEEEADIAEARSSPYDAEAPLFAPRSRDYDIRNRKWRRRVEAALVKMTAEVAALREQMEARRLLYDGGRRLERRKVWVWIEWLVGALVRHVLVDAVVVGVLWLWFRGGGERGVGEGLRLRVGEGVKLLMGVMRERGRGMEGWRRRRLWGAG